MGGLPVGVVYSSRAISRAPDSIAARVGLGFALFALLGLVAILIYSAIR